MSDDQSDNVGGSKRTYKIVLLGDQGVGKTSIISRFTANKFRQNENPTQGVDFFGKNVVHESTTHRLQLWDTSGNQRYRKLIPNYLKDAACGLFIYDRTDLSSLQNLQNWIKIFKQSRKQGAIMAFCQNKNDLPFSISKNKYPNNNGDSNNTVESKSQIQNQCNNSTNDSTLFEEKVKQLIQKYQMTHFSVSAAAGKQIHPMFHDLIDQIKQKWLNTSGSASKIKELMEKERIKSLIQQKIAEKQQNQKNFTHSNSLMTQQHIEKSSSITNFDLTRTIEQDNKSEGINHGKGKRRRKIHKISNIPSIDNTEDYMPEDEAIIDPPLSIWNRICPCLFK